MKNGNQSITNASTQLSNRLSLKALAVSCLMIVSSTFSANAALLLEVDLSVENQISIFTTNNAASQSGSGDDFNGIYLQGFFSGFRNINDELVQGDLSTFNEVGANTPNLFSFSSDNGLNIFEFVEGSVISVNVGQSAFTGGGTWNVDATTYIQALAGSLSGNLFFNADAQSDVDDGSGFLIGEWSVTELPAAVSAPTSLSLFLLAGFAFAVRRK